MVRSSCLVTRNRWMNVTVNTASILCFLSTIITNDAFAFAPSCFGSRGSLPTPLCPIKSRRCMLTYLQVVTKPSSESTDSSFPGNQQRRTIRSSKSPKAVTNKKPRGTMNKPRSNQINHSSSIRTGSKSSASDSGRTTMFSSSVPPYKTDYETNCGDNIVEQNQRFQDPSIGTTCVHFDTCAGCTIGQYVAETNIVQAAQRYFAKERYDGSSGTIRSSSTKSISRNRGLNINEEDDVVDSYPVVIPSRTTEWRTQAKLAVANKSTSAWKKEGCIFGLYQRGTHTVQPIPHCVVHHPSINIAVSMLEDATRRTGVTAYAEDKRDGELRYVQLQVERTTGQICLTLVWHAATLKECQPSLSRLVKALLQSNKSEAQQPADLTSNGQATDATVEKSSSLQSKSLWHSIWCHCNDGGNNNIFSRSPGRWHRLYGPEFLREPIPVEVNSSTSSDLSAAAAGWLYFSPLTFRQGNMDGFEILALDVARRVTPGSKVCELYGGVGVLGLTALAYHYHHASSSSARRESSLQWLRCSDENPANARCFNRALDSLPYEMSGVGSSYTESSRSDKNDSSRRKDYSRSSTKKSTNANDHCDSMTLGELAARLEAGIPLDRSDSTKNSRKATYMIASAAKALRSGQALGANVLIVDPPRKGLEDEVLDELCKPINPNQPYAESATGLLLSTPEHKVNWVNDVKTLIYVSCGFDALANDCDRLLSSTRSTSNPWTLQSTTGYILFPGSDHVETLAIFQRK